MAVIIDQAREIYLLKKVELETGDRAAEIYELYRHHPEFNILDKAFFKVMNSQADKIKRYIQCHIEEFTAVL